MVVVVPVGQALLTSILQEGGFSLQADRAFAWTVRNSFHFDVFDFGCEVFGSGLPGRVVVVVVFDVLPLEGVIARVKVCRVRLPGS